MGNGPYAYQNVDGETPYNLNGDGLEQKEGKVPIPKDKLAKYRNKIKKAREKLDKENSYKESEKIKKIVAELESYIGNEEEEE